MQQKLMQTMVERDARYHLEGHVQIDDAYLGGELTGGKAGRGSENKVPFVAAVSPDQAGAWAPAQCLARLFNLFDTEFPCASG